MMLTGRGALAISGRRVDFVEFEHPSALDHALAAECAQQLARAVAARRSATLVVSGGRTPGAMFDILARQTLPWQRITVTLADDRWLPEDHADSNMHLLKSRLLVGEAATARAIPLTTADATPEQGAAAVARRLAELPDFDLVLLGMGLDGHTASLFPDASETAAGLDAACPAAAIAVRPQTAPYPRISLTLPRLARSRRLIVQLAGADKLATLEAALADGATLPICRILAAAPSAAVYWSPGDA